MILFKVVEMNSVNNGMLETELSLKHIRNGLHELSAHIWPSIQEEYVESTLKRFRSDLENKYKVDLSCVNNNDFRKFVEQKAFDKLDDKVKRLGVYSVIHSIANVFRAIKSTSIDECKALRCFVGNDKIAYEIFGDTRYDFDTNFVDILIYNRTDGKKVYGVSRKMPTEDEFMDFNKIYFEFFKYTKTYLVKDKKESKQAREDFIKKAHKEQLDTMIHPDLYSEINEFLEISCENFYSTNDADRFISKGEVLDFISTRVSGD